MFPLPTHPKDDLHHEKLTYYLLPTTYYPYYLLILTPTTPKYASKGRTFRLRAVPTFGPPLCNPHHHGSFFCGARWRVAARRKLTTACPKNAAPTSLPRFSGSLFAPLRIKSQNDDGDCKPRAPKCARGPNGTHGPLRHVSR